VDEIRCLHFAVVQQRPGEVRKGEDIDIIGVCCGWRGRGSSDLLKFRHRLNILTLELGLCRELLSCGKERTREWVVRNKFEREVRVHGQNEVCEKGGGGRLS